MSIYVDQNSISKSLHSLCEFIFLEDIDSTNNFLKEKIKSGSIVGVNTVVLAQRQTSGRGTKGRSWIDDPESSLKLSVAISLANIRKDLSSLSPGLALNICKAVNQQYGKLSVGIKWPNDLIKDGKKLAGILIESLKVGGRLYLVIGIGLNLFHSKKLDEQVGNPVAYLFDEDQASKARLREELTELLSKTVIETVESYSDAVFSLNSAEWRKYDYYFNREVSIWKDGQLMFSGFDRGINATGQLIVANACEERILNCGEITLRNGNHID